MRLFPVVLSYYVKVNCSVLIEGLSVFWLHICGEFNGIRASSDTVMLLLFSSWWSLADLCAELD